jgi:hypothetical protein
LEKDRGAALTIQCYVDRLLSCGHTDVNDPAWWKRFTILLRGVQRKNNKEIGQAALQFHSALLGNGTLTEDSFNKTQERGRELLYSVIGQINPWEGRSYEERVNEEALNYKKMWMAATGEDPDSPEYKAKEEALRASIREEQVQGQEDDQRKADELREARKQRRQREKDIMEKRRFRRRPTTVARR